MAFPVLLLASAICTLSGSVHSTDGAPLRAHVVANAAGATRSADSDARGGYSVDVPCGPLRVTANASGYASTDVDIEATGKNSVDITLEPLAGGRLRQIGSVSVDGRLAVPHSTVPTRTITRADMDALGFDRVAQALALVPSATLTKPDGGSASATTVVSLRGPDPSETRIALDGQPLNDTNTGDFDLATFPSSALSGIDISEGLGAEDGRGADTIGGEINLISLRPTAKPTTALRLSAGSFGMTTAELNATGRINRFGYALALGDEQRAGYVQAYPVNILTGYDTSGNPITVPTRLGSGFSARTALANLTYELSERSSLRVRFLTVDDVRDESASQTSPANDPTLPPGTFVGSGPETASHSLRATLASLTLPLGAGTLVASGAFSSSTRAVAHSILTPGAGSPYDPSLVDKLGSTTLEWTHATETSSVAVGAQARAESLVSPDAFQISGTLTESATQVWLRASSQLTPRLRLAASVVDSAWSTYPASLDGRVGLALDDVAGGTLRFAVGTGFRAPLLAEKYVFPFDALHPVNCVAPNGNPNERAEHATEYELGYGHRFGSTTADVTLYRTNLRDPIENFYPLNAGCNPQGIEQVEYQSFPVNVGNVVYQGGALRLTHRFNVDLTATAEYAVNAAYPTSLPDFVSAANPTSGSILVPGQQFAGIPLQQYAFNLRYARRGTHAALALAGKGLNNELNQGRFATVDAAVGKTWGHVDLTLAGTNLTNAVSGPFTLLGQGTPYGTPSGLQARDALVLEPAAVRVILTVR